MAEIIASSTLARWCVPVAVLAGFVFLGAPLKAHAQGPAKLTFYHVLATKAEKPNLPKALEKFKQLKETKWNSFKLTGTKTVPVNPEVKFDLPEKLGKATVTALNQKKVRLQILDAKKKKIVVLTATIDPPFIFIDKKLDLKEKGQYILILEKAK